MNLEKDEIVFDIEADDLLSKVTKIHCLSWVDFSGQYTTIYDYKDIKEFFETCKEGGIKLIGHNIICYDIPTVIKITGAKQFPDLIDTLSLSWYLNHSNSEHGLEFYGDYYKIPKIQIEDWVNLNPEDYKFRCETDVKINLRLWLDLKLKLQELYGDDYESIITYLNFKMKCLRGQEENPVYLDYDKVYEYKHQLLKLQADKLEELKKVMPKVPIVKKKTRPKITHKKDGTPSAQGQKWFDLLKSKSLPVIYKGEIEIIDGYDEPNPNSNDQVKSWLFSLGWEPCTFKFLRDKDSGKERKLEQVRYYSSGHPRKGELTDSVLALKYKEPSIEILEGLTIINHRLGLFEGFLDCAIPTEDGQYFVVASAGGLTNTLRLKHRKPIANLPKVSVPWGKEIRSCIVSPKGHTCLGSDLVSLESTTKKHYMMPYDPDYVAAMSEPGFDEHLDLAVFAGAVTKEEVDQHKCGELDLSDLRQKYKQTNYSAIYGAKERKLSRETGLSLSEAKKLLEDYWERNHAVKSVAKDQFVKTLKNGEMWLYNPVSGFYYNLRFEKDIFSTLNQSTGVYCFDVWLAYVLNLGLKIPLQYHDEILIYTDQEKEDSLKLQNAIEQSNNKIQLNVPLSIDVKCGENYAQVH